MDAVDQQYQETAEAAGLPLDAMHRLKPAEMRVLQYLAENRGRIVAEPELAQHVFGENSREAALRVSRLLLPVRLATRQQADIRPMLTYYRGQLAVGLRWQAKDSGTHEPAQNSAAAVVRLGNGTACISRTMRREQTGLDEQPPVLDAARCVNAQHLDGCPADGRPAD